MMAPQRYRVEKDGIVHGHYASVADAQAAIDRYQLVEDGAACGRYASISAAKAAIDRAWDAGKFEEEKHPRAKGGSTGGQFVKKGGGGSAGAQPQGQPKHGAQTQGPSPVPSYGEQQKGIAGITAYLEQAAGLQQPRVARAGLSDSVQSLLLKDGQPYHMDAQTFAGPRRKLKECYKNAASAALDDPDLTYVEGVVSVMGIPIDHAWNVDKAGNVRDPTFPNGNHLGGYFGIPFKTDYLRKTLLKNERYGLLDMMQPGNRGLLDGETKDFRAGGDLPMSKGKIFGYIAPEHAAFVRQLPKESREKLESEKFKEALQAVNQRKETLKEGETSSPERIALEAAAVYQLEQNGGFSEPGKGTKPKDVKYEHRADFIIGYGGAGKSTSLAEPLVKQNGAVLVDSDEFKKVLPEYAGGIGTNATHEESSSLSKRYLATKAASGANLVIPFIGDNSRKAEQRARILKALGYQVHVHYLDVPWQTAFKGTLKRFEETGRALHPEMVFSRIGKVEPTFKHLQESGLINSASRYHHHPSGQGVVKAEGDEGHGQA